MAYRKFDAAALFAGPLGGRLNEESTKIIDLMIAEGVRDIVFIFGTKFQEEETCKRGSFVHVGLNPFVSEDENGLHLDYDAMWGEICTGPMGLDELSAAALEWSFFGRGAKSVNFCVRIQTLDNDKISEGFKLDVALSDIEPYLYAAQ